MLVFLHPAMCALQRTPVVRWHGETMSVYLCAFVCLSGWVSVESEGAESHEPTCCVLSAVVVYCNGLNIREYFLSVSYI